MKEDKKGMTNYSTVIDPEKVEMKGEKWNRAEAHHRNPKVADMLDYRWSISRSFHFSKNTFFHEYCGPITLFEIIALLLVIVLPIVVAIASGKGGSGSVTEYIMFLCVLVAIKTNVLQFLLGVSWERAILFHKVCGMVSLACAAIHGLGQLLSMSSSEILADSRAFSGMILLILLGLQPILYAVIKPYFFEVFYFLHLAVYFVMVYYAVEHGAPFVLYSVIVFAVDLAIRFLLSSYRVQATIESKPGDVIEMSFTKNMKFRAGQYVFLMIPKLGVYEWHPFTVSSAPHAEKMTLHIKALGDWTRKLAALAENGPAEVVAFVEGPYGLPAVNLEDETYQVVVLVSGAIGVTPHTSVASHLVEMHARGRPLKKLVHVWALRDPKLALANTMMDGGHLPRNAVRYATAVKDNTDNTEEDMMLSSAGVIYSEVYCTNGKASNKTRVVIPTDAVETLPSEEADLEAATLSDAVVKNGRPDFTDIFARVKALALAVGEKRVAVSVCGPASMVQTATAACRAATSSEVQMDLHVEVFNF